MRGTNEHSRIGATDKFAVQLSTWFLQDFAGGEHETAQARGIGIEETSDGEPSEDVHQTYFDCKTSMRDGSELNYRWLRPRHSLGALIRKKDKLTPWRIRG